MTAKLPARLQWFVRRKSFSFALVAVLDIVGILVTVDFGTYLGFNFHTALLYPIIALILAIGIGSGLVLENKRLRLKWKMPIRRKNDLIALLVLSAIPRLVFAAVANPFPDEYDLLLILKSYPLENLSNFMTQYQSFMGPYSIHPPLGFLAMSVFYTLVPTPFGARIPSILLSTGMTITVYYLIRENFTERAFLPALIFAWFPQTVLFLSVALTDVYLQFFGLLAIWSFLRASKSGSVRMAILSGVFLGLAFWSKATLWLFWGFLMILAIVLWPRGRAKSKRLLLTTASYATAVFIIGIWYLIDPAAFVAGVFTGHSATMRALSSFLNVFAARALLQVTAPFASTTNCSSILGLCRIFSVLSTAKTSYVSYPELLVQIPLWLTPVAILLTSFAIFHGFTRRDRPAVFAFLWLLVPLVAMIPGARDIRYLILFAVPVALFAARGIRALDRGWKLKNLTLASMIIFLSITAVVAEQQYYGPGDAATQLVQLGFGNGRILTNWSALRYYLPNAEIFTVNACGHSVCFKLGATGASQFNASQAKVFLTTARIDAVVMFYSARDYPVAFPDNVRLTVESTYTTIIKSAPSNFAWYEILYNVTQGKALQDPSPGLHTVIRAPKPDSLAAQDLYGHIESWKSPMHAWTNQGMRLMHDLDPMHQD